MAWFKWFKKAKSIVSRDEFLSCKMEWYELENGNGFYIRELGWKGETWLEYKQRAEAAETDDDFIALLGFLFVRGVCDKNGALLFNDNDIPVIAEKNPVLLRAVTSRILELSGIHSIKNAQSSSTTELPTN